MSGLNIYAFRAFLKDLKFKSHQLSHIVDELDMFVFSLRRLSETLKRACDDMNRYD